MLLKIKEKFKGLALKEADFMITHFVSSPHLDLEAASARPDCHLVRLPLVLPASRGGGGGGCRPVAPVAPSGGGGGQPGGGGGDGGDAVVAPSTILVLLPAQAGAQATAQAVHPARRAVLKILGEKIKKIKNVRQSLCLPRASLCKQQQKSTPFGGNGTSVTASKGRKKSDPSKKPSQIFPFLYCRNATERRMEAEGKKESSSLTQKCWGIGRSSDEFENEDEVWK